MTKPKNIDIKIKKAYVLRYRSGENPGEIGREIIDLYKYNQKVPRNIVISWNAQFKDGRLSEKSIKKRKKSKISIEDILQEQKILWESRHGVPNFSDDNFSYLLIKYKNPHFFTKKERFNKIYKDKKISKVVLFKYFKVSKSGYYKWLKNKNIHGIYDEHILNIVSKYYHINKGVYGVERLMWVIHNETGYKYNIKTIRRYMNHLGLKSIIRKKRNKYVKTSNIYDEIPNIIGGDFEADAPLQKIYSDTTEFYFKREKYILCIVIDGYNNQILSYSLGKNKKFEIVHKTLEKIKDIKEFETILHTDNGVEYVCNDGIHYYKKRGIILSTTAPGSPLQNRPAEYFFNILKNEYFIFLNNEDNKDLQEILSGYIYNYNNLRPQKTLNWNSPINFKYKNIP